MGSKRQRLTSLRALAGNDEALAMRLLADSLEQLRRRGAELERLRSYLEEYQAVVAGQGSLDAARWQNVRMFMQRLGDVIGQREAELEELSGRREAALESWRAKRGRTQAFDQLLTWHDRDGRREQERRDQKELDELNELRRR